ncbi:MAG: DoxX family protein [Xanthobacteraceae bacterium]|uniref:DoxX family protein n=1 Tax=Pseudolabrys sp. TaxID=1960880 RepID=UPI003D14083D
MNFESRPVLWTGRVVTALVVAFLLMDAATKLIPIDAVVQGMREAGIPLERAQHIGLTVLVCAVLYALPRTAVLGAVLITGFLGGAMAAHLRDAGPLWPHNLTVLAIGALAWAGLYLRDPRLRALFPYRND